jgi:hypothetical protein
MQGNRWAVLRAIFAIDPRSLAACRIALGAVLLVDLCVRATDLGAMYTDDGMFSRATICRYYGTWNWSFHFGSGSSSYQAALFAFAALLGLMLLVGFETRLATAASWLMLISLHNRVPLVLSGADNLARLLLFWGMFLPLGRVWSVDSWLARRRGVRQASPEPILSVATAAVLLQVALVYLFSAVFKLNADWFQGRALAATLRDGFYGTPIGAAFLEFPRVLAVLTVGILVLEGICPFLLFSPARTGRVRLWVLGILASMHLGIALILNVGLFPAVSLSGLLLFVPPVLWDRLSSRARADASDSPRLAPAETAPVHPASQIVCALALGFVLFTNVNGLPPRFLPWTPAPRAELLTVALGLGQKWDMFADAPSRNGWYVAKAVLADGTEVDLLREGAPPSWERPRNPAAIYPNERWRKILSGLSYGDVTGYDVFRRPVAEYLCREWDRGRPPEKRVADFALVFCMETSGQGSGPASMPRRVTLVRLDLAAPDGTR